MKNYLLNNYNLSKPEILQSLFISEYGLRHLAQAKTNGQNKWGHRIIALIEFCPVVGLIASVIEAIIAKLALGKALPPQTPLITNKKWLLNGNQSGCNGPVSCSKVESIRIKLCNQNVEGIQFNQSKVADWIKGGTCSAMSLEFLDSYFKSKKVCKEKPDFRSEILLNHIMEIGRKFTSSSEEMRTRQAAFNTIEVKKQEDTVDYSRNKIQALANFHFLSINHASKEMDVDKMSDESEISQEVDKLPEGAFFIRILKPANNEKQEEHGHSLVYIKEEGLDLFYDPNFGIRNISSSERPKVLFDSFKSCFQSFQTDKARFYRLQPTT